jgi:hypothetical protein
VDQEPEPPAVSRFSRIMSRLCEAVSWYGVVMGHALARAIISRLERATLRFIRVIEHIEAGTLRPTRQRELPDTPRVRAAQRPPLPGQPDTSHIKLPRNWGWLCPLVPSYAATWGGHLVILLRDPEMQALMLKAPRLWRILRPILHMTAANVDPGMVPPPEPRRTRPKPPKAERAAAADECAPEPSCKEPQSRRARRKALLKHTWYPHHPVQARARLLGLPEAPIPFPKKPG